MAVLPAFAVAAVAGVLLEERGGFPVKLKAGGVHPKDWITAKGVKIMVAVFISRSAHSTERNTKQEFENVDLLGRDPSETLT